MAKAPDKEDTKETFLDDLVAGKITSDAVEYFKIAVPEGASRFDVDTPQQKQVDDYVNGIIHRLLDTPFAEKNLRRGDPIPRFRVFVEGDGEPGAGIVTKANPPLIIITKGLFREFMKDGREDLLAGVLGHELTHYYVTQQTARKANSKIEEGMADAIPTFMLYHAGYQYTALQDAMKIIGARREDFEELFKYLDVHPSKPLRARFIEDSFGVLAQQLRRALKDFKEVPLAKPTEFPPELVKTVAQFYFVDDIKRDFYDTRLSVTPYAFDGKGGHEDLEETRRKVRFAAENLPRWLDPEKYGPMALERRARELSDIFDYCFGKMGDRTVTLDIPGMRSMTVPDKSVNDQFLAPLTDAILRCPAAISMGFLSEKTRQEIKAKKSDIFNVNDYGSLPAHGLPQQIRKAFDAFGALVGAEAPAMDDAILKAQALIAATLQVSAPNRWNIQMYHFGLPGKIDPENPAAKKTIFSIWPVEGVAAPGVPPPWNSLVALALKEYAERKTTIIGDGLLLMGISDPRLETIPAKNPTEATGLDMRFMTPRFPAPMKDLQGGIVATYNRGQYGALNVKNGDFYRISTDYDHSTAEKVQRARDEFRRAENSNANELRELDPLLLERIKNVTKPDHLPGLLAEFPLQLAYPRRLMGGDEKIVAGDLVTRALAARLDSLVAENPDLWKPAIRQFVAARTGRNEKDEPGSLERLSCNDALDRLRSTYSDHVNSGGHDYVNDFENRQNKYGDPGHKSFYHEEELGMHPEHPYVDFLLRHTPGTAARPDDAYLTLGDALMGLDRVTVLQVCDRDGRDLDVPLVTLTDAYAKLIGANGLADTDSDLASHMKTARRAHPAIEWEKNYGKGPPPTPEEYGSAFMLYQARNEAHRYLSAHEGIPLSYDSFFEVIEASKGKVGDDTYSGFHTGVAFNRNIGKLLDHQFEVNVERDRQDPQPDPMNIARFYALYESTGYFQKRPDIRWGTEKAKGYDDIVAECLDRLQKSGPSGAEDLQSFTETLLFGCNVQSPDLRAKLVKGWAEAIAARHGLDQTPAFDNMSSHPELSGYYDALLNVADKVLEKTAGRGLLHEAMLSALCDAVESQNGLTQEIGARAAALSREEVVGDKSASKGPLAEFGLDFIIGEEKTRLKTIDLLTQPLNDKAIESYIDVLAQRQKENRAESDDPKDVLMAFARKPLDAIFSMATQKTDFTKPSVRREYAGKIRSVYENFWESPLEVRTYYMSLMAFPEKRGTWGAEKTPPFEALAESVLDKVLPFKENEPMKGRFNTYTDWGRDFINAYLDSASVPERRLLLSALMVSAKSLDNPKDRTEESIGQALALVLQNMGPAGVKLAQAIHSYPDTPEPIRKGMEGVKGEANKPSRKAMFDRIADVVPPEASDDRRLSLQKIEHVGGLLGAGSYQYTCRTALKQPLQSMSEASDVALTLLRDHVLTFAENEFGHFESAMDRFVALRKQGNHEVTPETLSAFRNVLRQAGGMAGVETDYDTGKIQADLMAERYNGLVIQVGERKVAFTTVGWLDHGVGSRQNAEGEDILAYKVASIAPGQSFNKWATTEKEESVKALCPALQTVEDIMLLSCGHFDHDRHGDNFNVFVFDKPFEKDGVSFSKGDMLVTGYDFGAVNLSPPTAAEKAALGKVIADSIADARSGSDIRDSLVQHLSTEISKQDRKAEAGADDFLSCALRGFLARGDFLRHVDGNALQASARAALSTGAIDGDILKSVMTAAMGGSMASAVKKMAGAFFSAAPRKTEDEGPAIKVLSLPPALKNKDKSFAEKKISGLAAAQLRMS